jgi:hypothetical protein
MATSCGFESRRPHQPVRRREVEMSDDGDAFEESEDDGVRDFDRLSDILFRHVSTFADEEGVADEMLVRLLLRLSLSVRMMTYAMSVANPLAAD